VKKVVEMKKRRKCPRGSVSNTASAEDKMLEAASNLLKSMTIFQETGKVI
jgi:hypothetical protein